MRTNWTGLLRRWALMAAVCLAVVNAPQNAMAKDPNAPPKVLGTSGAIYTDIAIKAWNITPRDKETTDAMRERTRKELRRLLRSDLNDMEFDSDYWKLLGYLREVPWSQLPSRWQRWYLDKMPNPRLTDEQREALVKRAQEKPTYEVTPKELDVYLAHAAASMPSLRERVVHFARRSVGQPYSMYLLGEYPNELYDPEPLFTLDYGDCVVFSEHTYAMALSRNWKEFFANLQKLRYKNGTVGMTTRNHYTEADWNKNNSWLVTDATKDLGATTVTDFSAKIDRAKFFAKFGIGQDIPVEDFKDSYIPADAIESVLPNLKDGDFVNVVRGVGGGAWVGHVGLIAHGKDGTVHFIHSTDPKSKEQPLMDYVNDNVKRNVQRAKDGKAQFLGMKFLRLRAEDLEKELAAKPPAE